MGSVATNDCVHTYHLLLTQKITENTNADVKYEQGFSVRKPLFSGTALQFELSPILRDAFVWVVKSKE